MLQGADDYLIARLKLLFQAISQQVEGFGGAAGEDDLLRVQENLMKGGLSGRTAQGKGSRTRAVTGIDGDVKLNRALWVMAENMLAFFGR